MKVIEKGKEQGYWSKEVTCTGNGYEQDNAERLKAPCGAKLEISISDVQVSKHSNCGGFESWEEYHFYCVCPECGSKTRLTNLDKFAQEYTAAKYESEHGEPKEFVVRR